MPSPRAGDDGRYRVDARGVQGLQVGDQSTQVNYFYHGTWTDGVAPRPLVGMSGSIDSPYRGLGAFGERDAALFFGREAAAETVLELISLRLEGTGLVVVSGVSGVGKSSLLRAGVLPRLRGAGLERAAEAASWPCLVFTPGRDPLQELAVRVAPAAGADAAAILPGLAADPAGFALTSRQAALARLDDVPEMAGQRRVLFIVDQFEQLFTQCPDEDRRRAFITALHAAAAGDGQQAPAAMVVLLVRADFEARLADYPPLAPAVQNRYLLTAMTELQLRMAITRPAAVAGSSVDDDLVRVLLEQARTRSGARGRSGPAIGAGALPLLSHALDQAWRRRAGHALTLADYEQTGGIEGAVAGSAQRAYQQLSPARQAMARQVFTRLTAVSSDGADTAVRATRADLTAGKADQASDVEAVLETFAAERLLILAAGTVEISHEVLLTAWPLLRDTWLADTRADRAVRTRLQATAEEWDRANREPSYLYSGSRLDVAEQAAARIGADARQTPPGQVEEDFLLASRQAAGRRTRRRQSFVAALLALVIGLAVVSAAAVRTSHAATYQRDIAISGELASDSEADSGTNPTASQLESIAAWGIYPSAQAYYAMLTAAASPQIADLSAGPAGVNSVVYSPDGRTLAAADGDGKVKVWNAVTGQLTHSLTFGPSSGPDGVSSVAFSPDSKVLVTAAEYDGTVRLWNIATGQQIRSPTISSGSDVFNSVAFSPTSNTLATADYDGTAKLWSVATGQQIRSLTTGPGGGSDSSYYGTTSVAFSPDGKTLATANGTAKLWNVATSRQTRSLATGSGGLYAVAFSPDGKTLATADYDGTVRLWSVATGQQIRSLMTGPGGGSGGVSSLAFSPDGKTLATGDDDTVELWNVATGRQMSSLTAGSGGVSSLAFSPDGKTLATGDGDGTVRLWSMAIASQQVRSLTAGSGGVNSVVFSPDSKTLATGDVGGVATLWNVATGRQVSSLTAGSGGVSSLVFSPDSKTLATGEYDGTVELWNVATGRQVRSLATGPGGSISVAFSPDGKIVATAEGDFDDMVELWSVATGQKIRSFTVGSGGVNSVVFSPDGKSLATADGNGTAGLWSVATGQKIRSFTAGSDGVNSVAFSPDGEILASADDGMVELWSVATGQMIRSFAGSGGVSSLAFSPNSVTFSPDGKSLAATNENGTARIWYIGYLTNVLAQLCSRVGGSLTQPEWAQYVPPGPPYQNVCEQRS
jgi:WD40 repeat protein